MLLAYFGPETALPVTSLIATIVGGLLIGGRRVIRFGLYTVSLVVDGVRPGRQAVLGKSRGPASDEPNRVRVTRPGS